MNSYTGKHDCITVSARDKISRKQSYYECCNATKGIYYYTTYENHQISAVDMHRENLDGTTLICYPVIQGEQIHFQN